MSKWYVVTGGSGYIGAHTTLLLLQKGYSVKVVDRSDRLETILGALKTKFDKSLQLIKGDLTDEKLMSDVLRGADAVIHCAASKNVNLSIANPLSYYHNNVSSTVQLLKTMEKVGLHKIVFCSTSSMYKSVDGIIDELSDLDPDTPYSYSKMVCEQILADVCRSDSKWRCASLRFFNPLGYDQRFWDQRNEFDTSAVMPKMIQAVENQSDFVLYGDDYDTKDGTVLRDFVHINDLAGAIVCAAEKIAMLPNANTVLNIGTGITISMKQLLHSYRQYLASFGLKFSIQIGERRLGDIVLSRSNSDKAKNLLEWAPTLGLQQMIENCWFSD